MILRVQFQKQAYLRMQLLFLSRETISFVGEYQNYNYAVATPNGSERIDYFQNQCYYHCHFWASRTSSDSTFPISLLVKEDKKGLLFQNRRELIYEIIQPKST